MRDAALLGDRNLVGADVEAAVDRRRIARDDFTAEASGQRNPQCALARGGGPDDGDEDGTGQNQSQRAAT
jgi:hypothetical protein